MDNLHVTDVELPLDEFSDGGYIDRGEIEEVLSSIHEGHRT